MPDLDTPQTYGEWQGSIDKLVNDSINEQGEKDLAPIISNFLYSTLSYEELPPFVKSFLGNLQSPQAPSWFGTLTNFAANIGGGVMNRIFNHEFKDFDYALNKKLQNTRITPEIANSLKLRQKISDELWIERNAIGGYEPVEAAFVYEAQKPYPLITDIISYARYSGSPDYPKEITWSKYDVSPDDWDLWLFLSSTKFSTGDIQKLYQRGYINYEQADKSLAQIGWYFNDRKAALDLSYDVPNAMLLIQGGLMGNMSDTDIYKYIQKAGIHPDYIPFYYNAVLTKPDATDIINYQLRTDPNLSNLDTELRKIGIHTNYLDVYKTLAYPIPPVQDIITMAVREAFSPDIASRFGQYQDLPQEYIYWANRKGLTKEWAERYWAAHWSLPSPQQGFEMLHRGVINQDDLNLLLRALDIMPFWRDKLIQISYNPLTRVDVRRMFGLGVITETEVNKAYRDIGYNEQNAARLTEFTVRQTKQTVSKLTSSDIIKAFTNRFIDSSQATSLLLDSGLKANTIPDILDAAIVKREWAIKDDKIVAIENLYKKDFYTDSEAESELSTLQLPTDHIKTLLRQWMLKAQAEKTATWTASQTANFLKGGYISEQRARQELTLLGYNTERIDVYIRAVTDKMVQ